MQNYFFFYGDSISMIAVFTTTFPFFYLIGPLSFFYVRSIVKDNNDRSKKDYVHFLLFAISFLGIVPYFFTSWSYKLGVAANLHSDSWDLAQFNINLFIPNKLNQVLNVLHIFFYTLSNWRMLLSQKKMQNKGMMNSPQYKLIRTWLIVFCSIFSFIAINFCFAMVNVWLYDDKSVFLQRSEWVLLIASSIYVSINIALFCFPQILYGLPYDANWVSALDIELPKIEDQHNTSTEGKDAASSVVQAVAEVENPLQLFSPEYLSQIGGFLQEIIDKQTYVEESFRLSSISIDFGIPVHHLSYYFNNVLHVSFTEWRNNLRIEKSILLMKTGLMDTLSLQDVSSKCGFASHNGFIRAFKNREGCTPSEYLKQFH
jgi:AraC-like DNA-binding protein